MSIATLAHGRAGVVSNTLTIARRNLLHIKANPEQLVEMTIQPLMFLALFVYVFGGAIEEALAAAGLQMSYLQFVLPGILVQGIAFTPFTTALGLNKDFQQGLIDRFRSLPIARSSVIGGRIAADGFRIVWSVLIMVAFGMLLGFRFEGGALGGLGAVVLVAAFGLVICWPMAFLGITAKSPESVNTWGFMLILPITFVSSAFVDPQTMPGWLEAFANVNPVTNVIDAARGLMLGSPFPVAEPLFKSVIWLAVITAVFAPLAVARYRRKV
jgi:ABC transporter DrrB family efflux protein